MRDQVLSERDSDPNSTKKTHPAFSLTRSENSRADDVSVPLVPHEATGNSPTPVESSSSPHHRTHARTLSHTHTRAPLPPCHRPWRETRREPWGADGRATHPSQGNTTHRNAETPAEWPTLSQPPSKPPSHHSLTVFQPVQAHQPGVRSRLAFTSQFGFSFIVFGLDRLALLLEKEVFKKFSIYYQALQALHSVTRQGG